MNLYTKEQLKQAFIDGMEFYEVIPNKYEQDSTEYLNSIKPIELPSDEAIYCSTPFHIGTEYSIGEDHGFMKGAKWMREQILKQIKTT